MRKKNKALAILIGSALFTSGARFAYSYLQFNALGSRIHHIKIGTPLTQAVDLLGEPSAHDGRCEREIRVPPRGCSREFVYAPPLAMLFHDRYVISFSKEDRVIEAGRYKSP